ncbi:hypothetical protein YH66_02760 [[Brevibacterium] flavum]|uniref:Uncharacterized protein n=2 Tax=Corynebacterium TaxID=1716 RepID=A0A0F6WPV2_9CORY|nr:hypothetical protein YH66_02760 [[Brevibacterium] flavum]ANE07364.1 hypothetical protein A3654_02730 [Corynebacterium glutamicum]AST19782.1 hypothetical protein CEY17_02790 [Corynebacterium glutamicum ATCC 14067]KEI22238.1 hypothetical protein KIQ_006565 [Corynebacterium glutamicum ATCC 14067]OKX80173.1 hypothetical protein AUP70_05260 [Corynebacterium glutamicum]
MTLSNRFFQTTLIKVLALQERKRVTNSNATTQSIPIARESKGEIFHLVLRVLLATNRTGAFPRNLLDPFYEAP